VRPRRVKWRAGETIIPKRRGPPRKNGALKIQKESAGAHKNGGPLTQKRRGPKNGKKSTPIIFAPFVAIDSEGQIFPGDDIFYSEASGDVRYARHDTYLWGAAADDGRAPEWLFDRPDKKPLTVYAILDWLLSLPKKFGDAIFISFAFGYDATQIFKSMPFTKVYEILKRETYPDKTGAKKLIGSSPVFWDEYAFSYIKGKYLEIWKFRDRDKTRDDAGKMDTIAYIKIFDTFSFFQQGFSKVVDSMVVTGRATGEEAEFLSLNEKKP
jgi:hypothetical protein